VTKLLKKHLPLRPYYFGCPKCRNCCYSDIADNYEPLCPTYHYYRSVVYSGAGMNKLSANLFEGHIQLSEQISHAVYRCTLCGACDERCPMSCRPSNTCLNLRKELVAAKFAPPEPLQAIRRSIKDNHNPYDKPHENRNDFIGQTNSRADGEYLIFTGCNISYKEQTMIVAATALLDKLGITYSFMDDERCCGAPLREMGAEKEATKAAKKQFKVLKKSGKTIIFLCPSCYHTFKVAYKFDLPTVFLSELLAEKMKDVEKKSADGETVTYHDPCVLGRLCGVYDAPRELLQNVGGANIVEMSRSREISWCCGAGSNMEEIDPDFASWSSAIRTDEAGETKATVLLTSCPSCIANLRKSAGDKIKVQDLAEYLNEIIA
jgi:Fe-S oxidoreductase